MAYYCKDCSYQGRKANADGACPACGSFKVSRPDGDKDKPRPNTSRLVVLVALWVYLIGHIIWKLQQ